MSERLDLGVYWGLPQHTGSMNAYLLRLERQDGAV